MRLNNKMYCHYEMVRNFPKSYIEDGTTMSVLGPQGNGTQTLHGKG